MDRLLLVVTFLVLTLSSTAHAAQDPEIQYLIERLQTLEETVEAQRQEIESQRTEIEALKAGRDSSRVSSYETVKYEPRGANAPGYGIAEEELHGAVKDYLGTEEGKKLITDASPARIEAGYKVGKGFYLQTLDDKFQLQVQQRTQIRYTFVNNDHAEDTSSIRIRRQRVKFTGHAFTKDLTYYVQWDLAASTGAGNLLDAYVNYKITDWLQFRGGQWKVPYNRQRLASSGKQQFVDRSLANDEFQLDRDIGIMVHGKPMKGLFEYNLAVMQGAGRNRTTNTNNKHLYAARFAVNPFGEFKSYSESDLEYEETPKLALGAAYAVNNGERMFVRDANRTFNRDLNTRQATVDLRLKWRGFSFVGDYYWRDIDAHSGEASGFRPGGITANGHTVQAGYFVPISSLQKHLEFAGRYSYFDPDVAKSQDSEREVGFGVNWFFRDHTHKIQADVRHITTQQVPPQDDRQNLEVRMQYQLVF